MRILFNAVLYSTIIFSTNVIAKKTKTPWKEWEFSFTTPKFLPSVVSWVGIIDVDGYGKSFYTIDRPQGFSIDKWDEKNSGGGSNFNRMTGLPQIITFCWDSIIDRKTYETIAIIDDDVRKKMIIPYPDVIDPNVNAYRTTMLIGLAPSGIVRFWLKQYGRADIPLNLLKVTTTSGDDLEQCVGVTSNDFTKRRTLNKEREDFLSNKKYPYGEW